MHIKFVYRYGYKTYAYYKPSNQIILTYKTPREFVFYWKVHIVMLYNWLCAIARCISISGFSRFATRMQLVKCSFLYISVRFIEFTIEYFVFVELVSQVFSNSKQRKSDKKQKIQINRFASVWKHKQWLVWIEDAFADVSYGFYVSISLPFAAIQLKSRLNLLFMSINCCF